MGDDDDWLLIIHNSDNSNASEYCCYRSKIPYCYEVSIDNVVRYDYFMITRETYRRDREEYAKEHKIYCEQVVFSFW